MVAHDLLRAWFIATRTRRVNAAATLGISRQAMHAILRGALPRAERFEAIAEMTTGDDDFCCVPSYAWFVMGWEQSPAGRACIARANEHGAGIAA